MQWFSVTLTPFSSLIYFLLHVLFSLYIYVIYSTVASRGFHHSKFLTWFQVKDIFYRLGVKPVVYSLDEEPDGDEMEQIIKQRSESGVLPQTFVQGTNVGNYDQVKEEYESGKLGKLVVGPEANEIEVEDYDYDLIVVGGGSGGLAAAKVLQRNPKIFCFEMISIQICYTTF